MPEAWLSGPVADVPDLLQPVAHGLLGAQEEIHKTLGTLPELLLWQRPMGRASVGFHVWHLAGATDRLLAYALGYELSEAQRTHLAQEKDPNFSVTSAQALDALDTSVNRVLDALKQLDPSTLTDFRGVGRAQLPSTVMGLLFHAAEHAARHAGQITTTARLLRAPKLARVTYVVRDYDEAIAYLTDTLGFVVLEDRAEPAENKRWVTVAPTQGGTSLVLGRAKNPEQHQAIGNQTGGRVAFFLHTDDFWRDHARLTEKGVPWVREPSSQPYGTVAVFRDLYGNLWDLIGPGQ